jgi:hypothetical protein
MIDEEMTGETTEGGMNVTLEGLTTGMVVTSTGVTGGMRLERMGATGMNLASDQMSERFLHSEQVTFKRSRSYL